MAGFARFAFTPLDGVSQDPAPVATGRRGVPVLVDLRNVEEPPTEVSPPDEPRTVPGGAEAPGPEFTRPELEAAVAAAAGTAAAEAEQRVRAEVTDEVEGRIEGRLAAALEHCACELANLQALTASSSRAEPEAALAMAIARAIVPHALERAPLADIEAMLLDLLRRLEPEPRIELRLAPELVEPGRRLALEVVQRAGFEGELMVGGEAGLGPGEARVLWRHGRAERRLDCVLAEVEALLDGLNDDRRWPMPSVGVDDLENSRAAGATS